MSATALMARLRQNEQQVVSFRSGSETARRPFAQVYRDVARVSAWLARRLGPRARVGFIARNCYEFMVLDLACIHGGFHSVPLPYDEFGKRLAAAVAELRLELCFADDALTEGAAPGQVERLSEVTRALRDEALPSDGEPAPFSDTDVFTTIFTSGSTGSPKPLEVRLRCVDEFVRTCVASFGVKSDDRVAVFLPLTQFSSRLYVYGAILSAFDIMLSTPARIMFDLKELAPTILQGIPYLFESIYDSMIKSVRASRAASLAYAALGVAERILPRPVTRAIGRRVFASVHEFWGGRMRLLVSGAAPIRPEVLDFMNRVGIPMFEAYGLVETGVITLNVPGASRHGSVGRVIPGKEVQLDQDGTIIVRGEFLWGQRYEGAPSELNDRVFLPDGGIATGDIGYFDSDGYLFLRGRKDEVIVLSSGHKVFPTAVESHLLGIEGIKQAAVFGKGQSFLVCVAAPAVEAVSDAELQKRVERANGELGPTVQIKGVVRAKKAFSLENGQLTPNLKLNRRAIYEAYRDEIEAVYA